MLSVANHQSSRCGRVCDGNVGIKQERVREGVNRRLNNAVKLSDDGGRKFGWVDHSIVSGRLSE